MNTVNPHAKLLGALGGRVRSSRKAAARRRFWSSLTPQQKARLQVKISDAKRSAQAQKKVGAK